MKTDILIAGVGGQGTLLASVLLGDIAITEGKEVKCTAWLREAAVWSRMSA